ncbi:U5 small nuclear ribonucleoprotein subunit [Tieghemostelium lacteum]|uniref:116 kDa U5 small nuclear ribonucleoprotein component n=1 Tax=Tieghemostelium lacteum TaxID=361077 RepID=A0A152A4D2_TIELA|nr:U5 small nuclear ribonucleoprotein subunit [Tieghemostelium lacteum]|eukprot:KYR01100.1 U5 small nuclear ribonucleoprotein subunit [Tieghemostelium lacteum]
MSDSLYDEFGNYIGSDIEDEEVVEEVVEEENRQNGYTNGVHINGDQPTIEETQEDEEMTDINSNAIVLHEDKNYYPDAEQVYKGAEVMVQDEDTQPLTQPIINPHRVKKFTIVEDDYPNTTFTKQFLMDLMNHPQLVRNVCLLGSIHHGKTTFMDMLYLQTHEKKWITSKPIKYTDTRKDEQERGISIKASPMSLVLPNANDKSYLINILDTPGHPNFSDEVSASMRLCDGAVIVIDALEGVMVHTEKLIKTAVQEGLAICVVLNKIDRLILELKLPPNDAYLKIKHTLDDVNAVLDKIVTVRPNSTNTPLRISPELGNVLFSCSEMGWCFSLDSFSKIYSQSFGGGFNFKEFAKRLWGNLYFHSDLRAFRKIPPPPSPDGEPPARSFVHFILNPLYKIISTIIGEDKKKVEGMLVDLGVQVPKQVLDMDVKPLLRCVMSAFFGKASSFVDLLVDNIPSPRDAQKERIERLYTGPMIGPYAEALRKCDPNGPLLVSVTKLLSKQDGSGFDCLARVMSGTIQTKSDVRVLGEKYSPLNDEDMSVEQINGLYISEARYKIEVESVPAGSWVLIDGIDNPIIKTATITTERDLKSQDSSDDDDDQWKAHIFRPLQFINRSVCKVAIEPINPTELPKMLEALRKVNKSYPLAQTKAEESGEHILLGTGELYLDCMLHDLRTMYSDIEIKVDDPVISLMETVVETSSLKCYADTQNKKNRLSMIAEPLDNHLAADIESGAISMEWTKKKRSEFFRQKYDWDSLSADNVWAFGPEFNGPNVLINDILPQEVNRTLLMGISDSVVRGFQWATKEGPLVDEPIRNVKFKLLGAEITSEPIQRSSGHIVPASRAVTHSSFLTATPRLMEPIYLVEIIAPGDCGPAIDAVLERRRGTRISQPLPKPGTPLYVTKALLPVLDSYGFETDLRSHTQGQAFCTATFDQWRIVPGDPLDRNIKLKPLEPSPSQHLARELLIKTRRRKGLSEDVNFNKHFDDELLLNLISNNK